MNIVYLALPLNPHCLVFFIQDLHWQTVAVIISEINLMLYNGQEPARLSGFAYFLLIKVFVKQFVKLFKR